MSSIARATLVSFLGFTAIASAASAQSPGEVLWHQKISATKGGGPAGIKTNDQFARGSAAIGDLDQDGVPDLAVGALGDDDNMGNDALDYGAVWILFMNRDGTVKSHAKISRSSAGLPLDPGDEFGRAVRELGDFDLDGVPDIMVSADKDDDNGTDKGAFYLLFLNRDATVKSWKKISETSGGFRGDLDPNDLFGRALRNLGDLDLDGVPDIGVGAPWDDDGGTNRGAYWILFMRRDGTVKSWNKLSDWYGNFQSTLSTSGEFGFDCVVLGDRNGDGIQDIAIGSPDQKTDNLQQGAVFIVYLNRDGSAKKDFRIAENYSGFIGDMLDYNDEFGCALEGIGDLDGDGIKDLAVGVGKDDDGPPGSFDRGAVYILFLKADATVKSWQKISRTSGRFYANIDNADRFGTSLCSPLDLNGDGIEDLFAGARFDDDAGSGAGSLYFMALNDGTLVPPVAKFAYAPRRGKAPHAVQFTDQSTGNITGWEWDFGDGQTSNERNPRHVYVTTGLKSVSLTVKGPAGSHQRLLSRIIKVDPPLAPSADFSAAPTFGMGPLAVSFHDASTGLVSSYSWSFGDGSTSNEASPTHVYTVAGHYDVALTVANVTAQSVATRNECVVVTDVPPPVAEFDAAPRLGVVPFDVRFDDRCSGDVTSWSWSFGDGVVSDEREPMHTFTQAGTFDVTLIARGPGGENTRVIPGFVVAEPPPAPAAGFEADVLEGIDPLNVTFTDLSTGTVTARSWSFGDGATATAANPTHTYATPGLYTVGLVATGPGGSSELVRTDLIRVISVRRGLLDPSFEEQEAGAGPGGAWEVLAGAQHLVDPMVGGAADGSFPSDGTQWLRLSSAGTSFSSPPSVPGGVTLPPAGGAGVAQAFYLEDPLSVLELDASFALGGPAADALDNDWMSIDVSDGVTTVNLYYADGFSPMAGTSDPLGLPRTALQRVRADLRELFPASGRNTRFQLTLQVGNGAADTTPSYGIVDHLSLEQALGTALRYGCGTNPEGSLTVLSGAPRLGATLVLGVDNPLGTQGPNARAYVWLSRKPDAGFPCGTLTPGLGMTGPGADGSMLIDRTPGVLLKSITGGLWRTPGTPAPVNVVMPAAISWIGQPLYVQGYLVDSRETFGVRTGLTDGLKLLLAP